MMKRLHVLECWPARPSLAGILLGLALAIVCIAPSSARTLVATGSVWKYLDTDSSPETDWAAVNFDDSAWLAGPAPLGYDPEISPATEISYGPDELNKPITAWFRHTFVVVNAATCRALRLRVLRDDGVVIYLNGVEVWRDNLPPGEITATTRALAGLEEGLVYQEVDLPVALREGVNVLAAEVHQWDPSSSDLWFDLELSCPLARGPYLQMGTPTSVVVRWRTTEPTDSVVACGTSLSNLSLSFTNRLLTTEHEVAVTGLEPDTRYFYRVGSSAAGMVGRPDFTFVTAPIQAKPTRILVTSDMQWENLNVIRALEKFTQGRFPDLWLAVGDNGGDGDEAFQQNLFLPYADFLQRTVLWPCIGNHDAWMEPAYLEMFTLPTAGEAGGVPSGTERYYSFNYGRIHFVVLDSVLEDLSTNGPMYAWLQADLQTNDSDWLIAYWHYPPYTKGAYDSDWDSQFTAMRRNFLPLLEAAGVDLVLSGHNHTYERSYLLDSHYGLSTTLQPRWMIKNGGDGRWEGSGPYCKPSLGLAPHEGTVFAKVTSAYNYWTNEFHPAMFTTQRAVGFLWLEVAGPVLEATFVREDGQIGDSFVILKGVRAVPPRITGVWREAGQVRLRWPSIPYRYYRVLRSVPLASDWSPASMWIEAEGREMSWSEALGPAGDRAFYRLELAVE